MDNFELRKRQEKVERSIASFLDKHFYNQSIFTDVHRCYNKEQQVKGTDIIVSIPSLGINKAVIDEKVTTSFSVRTATLSGGSFSLERGAAVYVVTEGSGKIVGNGYSKDIKKGDYFLMPQCAAGKYSVESADMKIVECFA